MIQVLIVAVLLAAAGWLAWRIRTNLRRVREEARAREAAFLQELADARRAGVQRPPLATGKPLPPESPPTGSGASSPPALPPSKGPLPYLAGHQAKAFALLKAGVPGHEIFPRASLRSLLGAHALGKDLTLDFVICTPALRPIAVVDLITQEDMAPVVALKSERLAAAGLRYVRWEAAALPPVDRVAELLGLPPGG